jgi:hypothetical protein
MGDVVTNDGVDGVDELLDGIVVVFINRGQENEPARDITAFRILFGTRQEKKVKRGAHTYLSEDFKPGLG